MAADAESNAHSPMKRRDRSELLKRVTEVARFRDEVRSLETKALCAAAPVVRLLAYTVMHSFPGTNRVGEFVDSATRGRPDDAERPTVTTHENPLGSAIRIAIRDRRAGGRSILTTIRWIQPVSMPEGDITLVLSTIIPDEHDVEFVAPLADVFVRDITIRRE